MTVGGKIRRVGGVLLPSVLRGAMMRPTTIRLTTKGEAMRSRLGLALAATTVTVLAVGVALASAGWRGISSLHINDDPADGYAVCRDGIFFGLASPFEASDLTLFKAQVADVNRVVNGEVVAANVPLGSLAQLTTPIDLNTVPEGEPGYDPLRVLRYGGDFTVPWSSALAADAIVNLRFGSEVGPQAYVTVADCYLAWPFVGFQQPVDNEPTVNTMKAGRSVPVKFSLDGDRGMSVFADGWPKSKNVPCDGGDPTDVVETETAGNSSLSYDPVTDTYTYVWKTDKAWKGACRQLVLKLADSTGSEHTASFSFR
jgi:hypothetical protein